MTRDPRPALALVMKKELTSDLLGDVQLERLAHLASLLTPEPIETFAEPEARRVLAQADILLTSWGCPKIDAEALDALPRLKLIAHAGSSVKPLVTPDIWRRKIAVTSAAAANAVPVAEFVLAACLLANKNVFLIREQYRHDRAVTHYPWTAPGEKGNLGAIVGIVGASRTGRRLLALLRPFDMRVLVFDPTVSASDIEALGARPVTLDALAEQADVLSVHAPSLPATRHLITAEVLSRLRTGATIINTARGDVIDPAALERELLSGRLNAVLDVTDPEPLPPSSPLFDLPNVFVTPHVAGAAGHETRRLADLAIDEIARFVAGQPLQHQIVEAALSTLA